MISERNIECLDPVPAKTFSAIHEQKDCYVQASSESEKTLAFAIPVVQLLQYDNPIELTQGRAPRAIVLTASRDTGSFIIIMINNQQSVSTVYLYVFS